MASKTFLEMVNEAVDESKVSLDPLTSANFANPPRSAMYNRFKRWVNMAYRELMLRRKEFHFRTERATVNIQPRLHLSGLSYIPSTGDVLQGADSGVRFTVVDVHTTEDVEQDSTLEFTVSVQFDGTVTPQHLVLKENINRISPLPENSVGHFKGWGRYDFRALVNQLSSININTLVAQGEAGSTYPIKPVTAEEWANFYANQTPSLSRPLYVVETSQGTYDFHPRPDKQYTLAFEFTRSIPQLVLHSDTPDGLPEEYHDYLVWRAVQEFADFDTQQALYLRARKHVEEYLMWIDRDEKQVPTIGVSKFSV